MSKTMIDPQAIASRWGGVRCYRFGADVLASDVERIFNELKDIANGKVFYNVLVWDAVDNLYLGDCELVAVSTDVIRLRQTLIQVEQNKLTEYNYYFRISTKHFTRTVYVKTLNLAQ